MRVFLNTLIVRPQSLLIRTTRVLEMISATPSMSIDARKGAAGKGAGGFAAVGECMLAGTGTDFTAGASAGAGAGAGADACDEEVGEARILPLMALSRVSSSTFSVVSMAAG